MTRKILAPYGALKHLAVATKVGTIKRPSAKPVK